MPLYPRTDSRAHYPETSTTLAPAQQQKWPRCPRAKSVISSAFGYSPTGTSRIRPSAIQCDHLGDALRVTTKRHGPDACVLAILSDLDLIAWLAVSNATWVWRSVLAKKGMSTPLNRSDWQSVVASPLVGESSKW